MAGEYTAGVYAELKPIEADFGKTAQDEVDAYWKKNALKIQQRKAEQEAIKAQQEKLDKNLKDLQDFVNKIPQLDAKNYDEGLVSMMMGQMKEHVANLKRVMLDPNSTAQQKIDAQTAYGEMINMAKGYKAQRESWDKLCAFMGNQENLDAILNSDLSADFADDAFQKESNPWTMDENTGVISNGGAISYKVENGTPKMTINLKRSGETFTGTQQEVAAWIMSKVQNPVDEQAVFKNAGSSVKPQMWTSEEVTDNGFVKTVSYIDEKDFDKKVRDEFRMLYPKQENPNNYSPAIRKLFRMGSASDYQNLEDEYVKAARAKYAANGVKIRNKPRDPKGAGSQEAMDTISNEFLAQAQSTASGDKTAANYFVGRRSALNVPGVKAGDAKIESIDIKDGKVRIVVGGDYEKGYPKDYNKEYLFDVSNPEDQGVYLNALAFAFNDGKPAKQQVDVSALRNYYDSSVPITNIRNRILPDDIEKDLSKIIEKLKGAGKLKTDEIEEIVNDLRTKLHNAGYDMDINGSWFGSIGNMEISIKDENGRNVKKIRSGSKEILANDLKEFVSDVLGRNEVSKNDSWLLGNRKSGKQPIKTEERSTQKGVVDVSNFFK